MVDRLLNAESGEGRLERWLSPLTVRAWISLVAAGAGVRVLWVLVAARPPGGLSDPLLYQRFAQGIARGDGYTSFNGLPTSYYPPGYPFALGGVQWVMNTLGAGSSLHWGAGIVQALLGGLTAGLIAVAGARLFGARVGIVAGVIVAAWPNLIFYSSVLLSETLFLTLYCAGLAGLAGLSARTAREHDPVDVRPGWRSVAPAAVGFTGAAMVRPQVLLVIPAVILAYLAVGRWRDGLKVGAVIAVTAAVVIAPWFVRNLVVMEAPILVSTNGGDNLCVGFHEGAPGHFVVPDACNTGEFYIDGPAAEVRRNTETARRARTWAFSHLSELPALSVRKLWYTYEADSDGLRAAESYEQDRFLPDGVRSVLRVVANTWYAAALLLAGYGAVRLIGSARRERADGALPAAWLVLTLTAAASLVPILVFGDGRFKVPATPAIALLAAVGAVRLWDLRGSARGDAQPAPDSPDGAPVATSATEGSVADLDNSAARTT